MSVSDPRYLLLLGLAMILLSVVRPGTSRWAVIVLLSAAFYVSMNPSTWYALPIVGLTAYAGALVLDRLPEGRRRTAVFLTFLIAALVPLLTFKYALTLVTWLDLPAQAAGSSVVGDLALPVGISFYTFLVLGYLIEVYVGNVAAERNAIRFAAFISFFPQLTAGPIERAQHLLPQLEQLGVFGYARAVAGLRALLVGLFMKIVIADSLSPYVDTVYAQPRGHGATDLGLATIYFSFQVYADFAGYSLIAIGSARLLGIELLPNFKQPYLSQNLPEFWRTWHMTLSAWFRDYVFTPLHFRVRRSGAIGLVAALIFTFVLVGVWHGAGAKYALFGAVHGVLVSFSTLTWAMRDRFWRGIGISPRLLRCSRAIITFLAVSLTFVLFRANDLDDAIWIYRSLLAGWPAAATLPLAMPLALILVLISGDLLAARASEFSQFSPPLRWSAYYALSAGIAAITIHRALGSAPHVQQFIYTKF